LWLFTLSQAEQLVSPFSFTAAGYGSKNNPSFYALTQSSEDIAPNQKLPTK
jgi:hypothetical protein